MLKLAGQLKYDFNGQGYDFAKGAAFTRRDEYRQPDSIAGFAYNMLFAALHAERPAYFEECEKALRVYSGFEHNPWYEIPNGSAGLMAACWLNAHGSSYDVRKLAGWVFDHDSGPLQTGRWGGEEINGLMMGWRGLTRADAVSSAYSMETLMPLQFLLPAVKYCPALAEPVAKYTLNVLSCFQLFFASGKNPIYETKPELSSAVPYEKLERERDGHTPAACGDFWEHRSIYGAGYLFWMEALARRTSDPYIFALDLSLSDWLAESSYPVFLLRNPHSEERTVSFTPAGIWRKKYPGLFPDNAVVWDIAGHVSLPQGGGEIHVSVGAGETKMIAVIPPDKNINKKNGMLLAGNTELASCDASNLKG